MLELISWLDLEITKPGTWEADSFPNQLLARCVIALGHFINPQLGNLASISKTIQAAETYVLNPQDLSYRQYQNAATNSYPFGPGDGCFHLAETGYNGCEPGTGCRSGSGCLLSHQFDAAEVMAVIAGEVMPWLEGDRDPVLERSTTPS